MSVANIPESLDPACCLLVPRTSKAGLVDLAFNFYFPSSRIVVGALANVRMDPTTVGYLTQP